MFVSALISSGCRSTETNTNTATANSAVNATNSVAETMPEIDITQPFVPAADPKMDIVSATMRLQGHDAWSATMESNLLPEMKTELEYIKPDRYRIKSQFSEVIAIGNDAYIKQKGVWEKSTENIGAQMTAMKKNFSIENMKSLKDVRKSGTEKLDGKDAAIYTYSVTAGANTPPNSTKVWIDSDGLPLKIVAEVQTAEARQIITRTYDYTKKIKIEAPPVKTVAAADSAPATNKVAGNK